MDEVNDEVDDALEDYSEIIIIRALAGEELPSRNTASNNQYFLKEVTEEYAVSRENILYKDSMVYIPEKGETEPARILTTLFKDDGDRFFELTVATPSIEKGGLERSHYGMDYISVCYYVAYYHFDKCVGGLSKYASALCVVELVG